MGFFQNSGAGAAIQGGNHTGREIPPVSKGSPCDSDKIGRKITNLREFASAEPTIEQHIQLSFGTSATAFCVTTMFAVSTVT